MKPDDDIRERTNKEEAAAPQNGEGRTPPAAGKGSEASEKAAKKRRIVYIAIAAAVVALAVLILGVKLARKKAPATGEPESTVSVSRETSAPEDKLTAARAVNPDVVGWLSLPGAEVDAPVVQGADNDVYLRRTWDSAKYDVWGCYFLDYINTMSDGNFTDKVSIIYGHSLEDDPNNKMFSKLKRYNDPAFCEENRNFTLTVLDNAGEEKVLRFAVGAVCTIPIFQSGGFDYIDPNPDEGKMAEMLNYMLANSTFDFGLGLTTQDKLLILSTCTSDENVRFVVVAKLA